MKISEKTSTPDFITKSELANHLGCDIHTIDKWIISGTISPPHARMGKRHAVWLRRHYNAFVKNGSWPAEAYPHLAP